MLEFPRIGASQVGPLTVLVAIAGVASAVRTPSGRLVLGWLLAVTGAAWLPVLAGTPLNERYFIATFVLTCLLAAAGGVSLLGEHQGRRRLAGGVCCLALVLQVAVNVRDAMALYEGEIVGGWTRRDAAESVLTSGPIPCRPVVVPADRVRMLAAV